MAPASSQPTIWQQLTGLNLNPIWSIRIMTAIALLTTGAAMWVFKSGNWHAFLVGATFGILIGLFAQACNTRSIECGPTHQPSDVDDLRVTRV